MKLGLSMLLALLSLQTEDSQWRLEPPTRLLRTRLRSLLADGARIGGCTAETEGRRHTNSQQARQRPQREAPKQRHVTSATTTP
jgi:hypothetical protein